MTAATPDTPLRSVLADPENDLPRLVLADWLEEHGEGDRAEFIRRSCEVLARHTDCPTRLADLKAGRPVPLRCGVCDYCTVRRRCEAFYGRHPWVAWPAYAVAFEPTPLDGELPTGPGLTLVIRRGFVEEVRAPLAVLFGGTGHTEGVAAALWSAHPVTGVVLTDAKPMRFGDRGTPGPGEFRGEDTHFWLTTPDDSRRNRGGSLTQYLPAEFRGHLGGYVHDCGPAPEYDLIGHYFATRDRALAALSAACVRLGRGLAGVEVVSP